MRALAVVTCGVVLADLLFTASTIVLRPLTGWYLIRLAGPPFPTFFYLTGAKPV